MTIYYSPATGGFYAAGIHEELFVEHVTTEPETGETIDRYITPDPDGLISDAVEITADEHRVLLIAQSTGKIITADATGRPIAVEPPTPTDEQLATNARQQRDHLLRACDWTALADVPLGDADKAAWASYRQALRDVPAQTGFPTTITWPTAPGASA